MGTLDGPDTSPIAVVPGVSEQASLLNRGRAQAWARADQYPQ